MGILADIKQLEWFNVVKTNIAANQTAIAAKSGLIVVIYTLILGTNSSDNGSTLIAIQDSNNNALASFYCARGGIGQIWQVIKSPLGTGINYTITQTAGQNFDTSLSIGYIYAPVVLGPRKS
jgi:hypothetical protein